jgi:hypothetical protein
VFQCFCMFVSIKSLVSGFFVGSPDPFWVMEERERERDMKVFLFFDVKNGFFFFFFLSIIIF